MHTFPEHKSEHWIKPGSKLLFQFLDMVEPKFFTQGILDISFYQSINQKILSTVIKKINFRLFLGIQFDINQAMNDILTNPCVKIFRI